MIFNDPNNHGKLPDSQIDHVLWDMFSLSGNPAFYSFYKAISGQGDEIFDDTDKFR